MFREYKEQKARIEIALELALVPKFSRLGFPEAKRSGWNTNT
jgi:hypothetical protein